VFVYIHAYSHFCHIPCTSKLKMLHMRYTSWFTPWFQYSMHTSMRVCIYVYYGVDAACLHPHLYQYRIHAHVYEHANMRTHTYTSTHTVCSCWWSASCAGHGSNQVWHRAHGRFYAQQDGLGGVICVLFVLCVCVIFCVCLVFILRLFYRRLCPKGISAFLCDFFLNVFWKVCSGVLCVFVWVFGIVFWWGDVCVYVCR